MATIAEGIIVYLGRYGPATCSEIAQATGKSRQTINNMLRKHYGVGIVGRIRGTNRGRFVPVWGLVQSGDQIAQSLPPVSERINQWLQKNGAATAATIAKKMDVSRKHIDRTLTDNPQLFFVTEIITVRNGSAGREARVWGIVGVHKTPLQIVEWTHTPPRGKPWTMRGHVFDQDDQGLHVLSCGTFFVVAPHEARQVAA